MSEITTLDRTRRPEAEELPTIPFPHYETVVLSNGLTLFLIQDQRPSLTVRLMFGGGQGVAGFNDGTADAVADMLTKGTASLTAQEFASEIDFIGGEIGAGASADSLSLHAYGLKRHAERIMELLADALLRPRWDADELEKIKRQQIDGLTAGKKRSDFLAAYGANALLYGDTMLGKMPDEESIGKINVEELTRYYAAFLTPRNASIAIIGDLDVDEARDLLERHLGAWPDVAPTPLPSLRITPPKRRIVVIDRPLSVQSAIRVIGPGPMPTDMDRRYVHLLNNVFGGGGSLTNRLTMNLRETHGWTYSPHSHFDSNVHAGFFMAAAEVNGEVTDRAIEEILKEVRRLSDEPVTDVELSMTVKSAVGNYLMSLAQPTTTAMRVQSMKFYGLPDDYYDTLVDVYQSTTPDDLQRMARTYLVADDLSFLVVGKASELKETLARFGDVELWDENLKPIISVGADAIAETAEEIWDRMLTAMGGKGALQAIRALRGVGAVTIAMGSESLSGTFTRTQIHPRTEWTTITLDMNGMTIPLLEERIDPAGVTRSTQGNDMPIEEEEAAHLIAGAHILPEAWLNELGGRLELIEKRTLDGNDLYVIDVEIPGAEKRTYSIDVKSGLPVRLDIGETQWAFDRWEEIDGGIVRPRSLTYIQTPLEVDIDQITYSIDDEVLSE